MFDRHQAEITVMLFRGHSLLVYQSMSVPWDFLPCPISSAKYAYAIFSHNCHWNVSLPFGASLWNGKFAWAEGQNTTLSESNLENETADFPRFIVIETLEDVCQPNSCLSS